MYGHLAKYRYENGTILNSIYSTLPMDEFLQGNFSRGAEIIDQARTLIRQCLQQEQQRIIGENHTSIGSFIASEIERCLTEKGKLEAERETLIKEINAYSKNITALKKYCDGNDIKEAILKKFAQLEYNVEKMTEFMADLQYGNVEHYNKAIKDYNEMIVSPEYLAFSAHQRSYKTLIDLRKENTQALSHKGNMTNMTKQVEELQNGKRAASIDKRAGEKVEQIFQKRDGTAKEIDDRDLETIYKETLFGRLIINHTTPRKQKKHMLENISDKLGLFHYLNNVYTNLVTQTRLLNTPKTLEDSNEIRNEKMHAAIREVKNVITKINGSVYYHLLKISDEDITHIENLLLGPKTALFDTHTDEKLHKAFRLINEYLEHDNLEDMIAQLWNYDFWKVDHSKQDILRMAFVLLDNMTDEERELVADYDAQQLLGPYVRQEKESDLQGNTFSTEVFDGMIKVKKKS